MKKTTQLKQMIQSKDLSFLMEAHNGISAKIAEETGFKGIWGSGLSISAALGVRDNNEASWTQVVDVLEFMSDATRIPILLDGDTGYGNFNNMRRLVKKLEQRDIAGVCIEDKLFPKTNSFIDGEKQELADINEFCGKLKAAKDSQVCPDFCVVARTEAFIAGLGLEEALKRANAYIDAGADAILVHSKKSTADDVRQFMSEWNDRAPIVIVPTKYYSTPTSYFEEIGISTVIWANHSIRASINAIQETTQKIFEDQSLANIEKNVVPVSEIFRLQGASELMEAEKQYLPGYNRHLNAIILAAGASNFGEVSKSLPKSMLKVQGKPILEHQLESLRKFQANPITVVRGHHKNMISDEGIQIIDNDAYETTSEVYSLWCAKAQLQNECIVSYGDILYKDYVIHECLNHSADIRIVVDATAEKEDGEHDFVEASRPYTKWEVNQSETVVQVNRTLEAAKRHGEFIGLMMSNQKGSEVLRSVLDELGEEACKTMKIDTFIGHVLKKQDIHIIYIQGDWLDINTIADYHLASDFYA